LNVKFADPNMIENQLISSKAITCGGLMMAVKFVIPNMPRLEIVNVPPYNQSQPDFTSV